MFDLARFKGGAALQTALNQLPAKIERNIMRSALRAGGNVFKGAIQQNLAANGSQQTGELARGVKVSTRAKGGTVTATVRITGKHAYVAYWLEFTGAAPHVIKSKNGKTLTIGGQLYTSVEHPGFQPKPFARPAFDGNTGEALYAVGNQVRRRLTKEGINAPAGIELE